MDFSCLSSTFSTSYWDIIYFPRADFQPLIATKRTKEKGIRISSFNHLFRIPKFKEYLWKVRSRPGWYPAAQNISAVFGRCGWQPFADSRTRCPPPENVSRHIAGHVALIFMLRRIPPRPASAFLLFYGNKKHSQNGTGKSWKSWLLSVPFWLILFLS